MTDRHSPALALIGLLDVFGLESAGDVRQRVVDTAAETLEAELVGIACGRELIKATGIGGDVDTLEQFLAAAGAEADQADFGRLGRLHVASLPIDDRQPTHFVVARSGGPFDHEEIRLCRAMVRVMRLAVRTITAFDEQRAVAKQLADEVALNQALNTALQARHGDLMSRMLDIQEKLSSSPGSVLSAIFDQAEALFDGAVMAMHLQRSDRRFELQHVTANASDDLAAALALIDGDDPFLSRAVSVDRTVLSTEIDDGWCPGGEAAVRVAGAMTVPIHRRRQAVGTITLLSTTDERELSIADQETVLLLAGYASVAVSDARIIVEREEALAEAEWQATHDPLTGLANRRLVLDSIAARLDRGQDVAVLYIDVDRFKSVNDLYGHQVGDEFIIAVAQRLRTAVRPHDLAGRLAGDEFIVVLDLDRTGKDGARAMAERLRSELNQTIELNGRALSLTISVGLATSEGLSDAGDVINAADVAMYKAKSGGRNQTGSFDGELQRQIRRRAIIAEGLEGAIATGAGLSLVYQPIVEIVTGEVQGHESLLRYVDPVLGAVPPDEFIPLAEELGIICRIDDWVLDTALREATGAANRTRLSVNVSPAWLADPAVVDKAVTTAARHRFPLHRLTVEVTERAAMSDTVPAALAQLRAIGVRILLDDFGTGYSSLAYVRTLEIDGIKIDKGFLDGVENDRHSAAILEAVVTLTDRLGAQAIAEGVESGSQAALLLSLGCRLAQGFFFGRPVVADEAFARLIA
ncbi:MAG: EAL domain-containing protein [Acidimicrobiia bacterium]|nr:EAL domain-containing protein [Acidimicrobiia bacterium]